MGIVVNEEDPHAARSFDFGLNKEERPQLLAFLGGETCLANGGKIGL